MGLAAARSLQLRNTGNTMWGRMQIKTGQTVFQHQLLVARAGTQYCQRVSDVSTLHFLGLAKENYSTSLAASLQTAVYFWNCEARLPHTGITAGQIGELAYGISTSSVDIVYDIATLGPPVGVITELDGTSYAWVMLGKAKV